VPQGWAELATASVSIERFGASAPGDRVLAELGITAERVAALASEALGRGERAGR
jgi:transketolase